MNPIQLTVPLDIELTPEMIRAAAGPKMMSFVRQLLLEERRMMFRTETHKSSLAAYRVASKHLTEALARYENNVGSRDERKALAALISACADLRRTHRTVLALAGERDNQTQAQKET